MLGRGESGGGGDNRHACSCDSLPSEKATLATVLQALSILQEGQARKRGMPMIQLRPDTKDGDLDIIEVSTA